MIGAEGFGQSEGATGTPSFAELLRSLRERAGLTQEELAARAGLTSHAVSSLERGTRKRPYPHTVRALAEVMGTDLTELCAALTATAERVFGRWES